MKTIFIVIHLMSGDVVNLPIQVPTGISCTEALYQVVTETPDALLYKNKQVGIFTCKTQEGNLIQ